MSSTMFNKPLDTEFVGKINELSEQFKLLKTTMPAAVNTYKENQLPSGFTRDNTVIVCVYYITQYGKFLLMNNNVVVRIALNQDSLGIYTTDSTMLNHTAYVLLAKIDLT